MSTFRRALAVVVCVGLCLLAAAGPAAADPTSAPNPVPTLNPNSGGGAGTVNLTKIVAALIFVATIIGIWSGAMIIHKAREKDKNTQAAAHGLNVLIGWGVIAMSVSAAVVIAFTQSLFGMLTN